MRAVMTFSGGTPGAMTALMKMLTDVPGHDPDNVLGSLGSLIALDNAQPNTAAVGVADAGRVDAQQAQRFAALSSLNAQSLESNTPS